jgi:iron complex outermembrane receptor protein
MKTYFKPSRKPVALAVLALVLLQSASAQDAASDKDAPTAKPKAESPVKLEAIVVSGSRIKRDNFSTPAPVQIIRNEDAALAGFTSTTQVLQGTAVTGGQGQINNAFGGFVTDGGPGANTIGLRGFAPTRSLVLLNGRRLAPSGTRGSVGAADLNSLPGNVIDRIEVLKDGASSIYGSDAVAGVINIITKKNLNGITLDASRSQTQEGGGDSHNFSISAGHVGDSFRVMGSYQLTDIGPLTLAQRDWTQCNTDYRRTSANGVVGEWGSFDSVDPLTGKPKCYPISGTGSNGVTINTLGTNNIVGVPAAGALGTTFNRWRPNSGVTTGLVGFEGVGGGATTNLNVRDTFDPRMLNRTLISPVRSQNVYLQGSVDLDALGNAEVYAEFMLNRRESSQVGYRQLSLDYIKGSPLIPAGLAASTFSGPSSTTGNQNVGVRAFIGFGNDESSQKVDFARAVAGIRGSLGGTGWDYDVSWVRSESRGSYTQDTFLTDRLAQSTNVVASGSGFACVNPANGCVAAPVLSSAVIGGVLPQNWVNYVWTKVTGNTKYTEDVLSASVTGTLFRLPYGPLKAAFGAETRKNSIDDTPALDSQTGNLYNLTSSTPTRGSDKANDLFAEVDVPLLKNLPLVRELTLSASTRWADYRSYGSDSTYKAGALWSPVKWLSLRATTGTSYRAPALYEQFLGATSGFLSQQNDPCNAWDAATNNGTNRQANCRSEGLPAGFQATQSITSLGVGGREAGLKAETSKNNSWGVIFQPSLPSGFGDLSVAVDHFDVSVDNGVGAPGAGAILSRCYDSADFRAGGGLCRLVSARNPSSQALTVTNGFVNISKDIVRGFDYTARYVNDVGIGRLRVNLQATEYRDRKSATFATDPLFDGNGDIGNPKWSGALDINYTVKEWNLFYGLEWTGKMDSYRYLAAAQRDPATSTFLHRTPSYVTHAMSVTYRNTADKWRATLGVRNLLDAGLPVISAQGAHSRIGNAPLYSGYDYQGRRFFVNVQKSF